MGLPLAEVTGDEAVALQESIFFSLYVVYIFYRVTHMFSPAYLDFKSIKVGEKIWATL